MAAEGYSGTPLIRKLGLKPGMRVRLIHPPTHYGELLGDAAAEVDLDGAGEGEAGTADFIHLFATEPEVLTAAFATARAAMKEDGMVWASWPKKSSDVLSRVGRSEVMAAGKDAGLVDIKVCAVDATWSGLKFVIPLDRRRSS